MKKTPTTWTKAVHEMKRDYLTTMLVAHAGNRSQTAKTLGLGRPYVSRLIRTLGITVPPRGSS